MVNLDELLWLLQAGQVLHIRSTAGAVVSAGRRDALPEAARSEEGDGGWLLVDEDSRTIAATDSAILLVSVLVRRLPRRALDEAARGVRYGALFPAGSSLEWLSPEE